jgi:DUF1680 family protein
MEWTLTHPGADGMIGPATNNDWWPRMVMLKALTQYHEFTGDARVLTVMEVYFQHQLSALPGRPLRDWGRFRWQDEVVSVLWLYQRTGQPYLLDLARLLHTQGFDWQALFNNFPYTHRITAEFIKLNQGDGLKDLALSTHGVNNGQAIKAAAVWSLLSGSADDRSASLKMIATLEKYHGLPNGMFSCDEHLAGLNPSQGSELCTVVETMFSLEQCLAITGNPSFADRLEKLAFNALPGTLTDTMWAHQYNQEPNQVECSLHRQPWTTDGPESNLFGLEPNFGCCTANFHQGWPKLVSALFLRTGGSGNQASHGLVATVYAPCELHTELNGVPLRIVETTNYPFRGAVRIAIEPARPLSFALSLRIPAWAGGATIRINGKPAPDAAPETFARIERTWKAGDVVELAFPTEPRVSRWFNNSVAIERGPLVFSFGIGESWVKLRERGQASDWQVFPSTPWNYALRLDLDKPAGSIQVVESPLGPAPFARSQAPVRLHVKARQLDSWRAEDGVAAPPPPSPVAATGPEQTLELIPYAAAKLRVTAFPLCKEA